jgi:hypothetical protein
MTIVFSIAGCFVAAVLGIVFGHVLRRIRPPIRMWTYLAAVSASIIPYVLHYTAAIAYLRASSVEPYEGLEQYVTYFPVTVLVLTGVAFAIAWLKAAVAALLPIVLGGIYWYVLVPPLYLGVSGLTVLLDNVPFIWLFASSLVSFVILLAASLLALEPHTSDCIR